MEGGKGKKTVQVFYLKNAVMEIVGRLTADAVTRTVQGDKKVVGFSLAVNDSFRSGDERKEVTNYFECSYWRNEGIAEFLKKGGLVQIYGRVGVNAYISKNGEARGVLTFHVSQIKLFGGVPHNVESEKSESTKQEQAESQEPQDVPMEQAVAAEGEMNPSTVFDDVPSVETDDLPF